MRNVDVNFKKNVIYFDLLLTSSKINYRISHIDSNQFLLHKFFFRIVKYEFDFFLKKIEFQQSRNDWRNKSSKFWTFSKYQSTRRYFFSRSKNIAHNFFERNDDTFMTFSKISITIDDKFSNLISFL